MGRPVQALDILLTLALTSETTPIAPSISMIRQRHGASKADTVLQGAPSLHHIAAEPGHDLLPSTATAHET